MSGPIRNERPQGPTPGPRPLPKAAAEPEALASSLSTDVFRSNPEQLKAAQATLARVQVLAEGSLPLSNAKKKAFLQEARALLAEAEQAESRLFFANSPSLESSREAVSKLRTKVEWAEMRSGEKPMPAPMNPFRPLFPVSKASEEMLSQGGLWALVGIFPAIVAPVIDTIDLVTRPVQAVVWPFHALFNLGHKGVQQLGIG